MSIVPGPPPVHFKAAPQQATLRRLFLTVFLRGQSLRMQSKQVAPQTVAGKLALILIVYGLMGATTVFLIGQPVIVLSITLHAMTFLLLGMFIASAAGEVLFNKEEAEILMHRPVTSQILLRAKARVLVEVSLYLAAAINFVGLFVGLFTSNRGWLFPLAHVISTTEEALFCIGVVVLAYELCLRWAGRERLEGLMTTMQVLVIVSVTVGSQILPRLIVWHGLGARVNFDAWWIRLLPPAWFASLDDALSGTSRGMSWALAALGLASTALVVWLAFGKMASVYGEGWQAVSESASAKPRERSQYRTLRAVSQAPPLRWFLRDSVARASFQLVSAYLLRDRDTKLRVYPAIAPTVMMPAVLLLSNRGFGAGSRGHVATAGLGNFGVAFASVFLAILPFTALLLIKYSQQWRAAEVFVAAPIAGPSRVLQGARVAVILVLGLPTFGLLVVATAFLQGMAALWLILPGLIALPVYSLIPSLMANSTPLSNPIEEAQSAANFPITILSLAVAMVLAGVGTGAQYMGLLAPFLAVEAAVSVLLCLVLSKRASNRTWPAWD